jgi:hypothetical protein
MVLTLRLSVLYGLFSCTALIYRFCITEVESVYCAIRTESLNKAYVFIFKRLNQELVIWLRQKYNITKPAALLAQELSFMGVSV